MRRKGSVSPPEALQSTGQGKDGKAFMASYEDSSEHPGMMEDGFSVNPYLKEVKGAAPGAGGSQAGGDSGQASPAASSSNAGQPGAQSASDKFKMRPDLGDSVKEFESGKRGVGSVSSGVNDPGGVSYGTYQFSSAKGTAGEFIASPEGKKYAPEFAGLAPGSAEYSAKWKELAARDPDGLHQAEKEFIYRTHYLPQAQRAADKGLDMNNPAVQDAVWSGTVQHGPAGFGKVLNKAEESDPYFKYRSTEDQLKEVYWARSGSAGGNAWGSRGGRYFGNPQNQPGEFEVIRARNDAYQEARRR